MSGWTPASAAQGLIRRKRRRAAEDVERARIDARREPTVTAVRYEDDGEVLVPAERPRVL